MADELIGIFHFINAACSHFVMEPFIAPVLAHLGMDEVLVDGSEIRGQDLIQDVDDALFRFHGFSPFLSFSALKGALTRDAITAKWPCHKFIINTSRAFVNSFGRVSLSLIFIISDTGSQSRTVTTR
jgi:hypothetical protein